MAGSELPASGESARLAECRLQIAALEARCAALEARVTEQQRQLNGFDWEAESDRDLLAYEGQRLDALAGILSVSAEVSTRAV